MYTIRMTKTFRRDTERCRKRGYDMELLKLALAPTPICFSFGFHMMLFSI